MVFIGAIAILALGFGVGCFVSVLILGKKVEKLNRGMVDKDGIYSVVSEASAIIKVPNRINLP